MYVIGTAGHVDHGKSTLVAALTGIHPDRLEEEKAREMTIDLGFAWFDLPDGSPVGVVDVPGHRDFIENMLAGVGGIDAAVLVIAADEGVMPQTREHLAILDLLQIPTGVVALTKCDLVNDAGWLEMVEEDIGRVLRNTCLADAEIIRVSARTGDGLPALVNAIHRVLLQKSKRPNPRRPRLPVDRVFTMTGFGTVVTGTLLDGTFHVGDEIVVLPSKRKARIRGLQTHKAKEEFADPGQRTAINLSGVDLEDVKRGDVIAILGSYPPGRRLDAEVRLLPDASLPLDHHAEVKFFLGTMETIGRIRLLDQDVLTPGKKGLVQFELRDEVVAFPGDRFILRRPSPAETIGGGMVIHSPAEKRYKRFAPEVLSWLNTQKDGNPLQRILHAIQSEAPALLTELAKSANMDVPQLQGLLAPLIEDESCLYLQTGNSPDTIYVLETAYLSDLLRKTLDVLAGYHRENPLKAGVPREELKTRLKLPPKLFASLLRQWVGDGSLAEEANIIRLPGFAISLTTVQQQQADRLLAAMRQDPYSPPSVKDVIAGVGEPLYQALQSTRQLRQVSPDVVFAEDVYQKMVEKTIAILGETDGLSLAQWRDHFQTSRKYAQAFLEYLDQMGVTVRAGDLRRLKKSRS